MKNTILGFLGGAILATGFTAYAQLVDPNLVSLPLYFSGQRDETPVDKILRQATTTPENLDLVVSDYIISRLDAIDQKVSRLIRLHENIRR